ncbi:hypothetical protein [Loigolactobacillus iwatensis]|uniref:hypothetical protein n=1 Tax=Loigolactobacillus iwatensis TaxID=1267156 RepID=UPI000F7D8E60|nr:hypothetical protein [Loigolactobacillus iwatensis]
MPQFKIGHLLTDSVTHYQEQITYEINNDGLNIFLALNRPTLNERTAIQSGKINYTVTKADNIILNLLQFTPLNWMLAPYNRFLETNFDVQKFTTEANHDQLNADFIFVDGSTGILLDYKILQLAPAYWRRLSSLISQQQLMQPETYNQRLEQLLKKQRPKDWLNGLPIYTLDQL